MCDSNEQESNQSSVKGKVTNNERNLVVSFIQFLRQKVSADQCTDEQIEVAVQCLEGAFNLTDRNYAFQPTQPLLNIFKTVEGLPDGDEDFPTPTNEEIEKANQLKEEGNDLVKAGKLQEAVQKYNEAIKLNRYPIYFCNRAAAYCRLEQFDLAIQDCRTALALDPNYAKAYGRMGVALSCQNRYDIAVEAYKKASELDPNNESYKTNLALAEEKKKQAQEAAGSNPPPPGQGLGGLFGNLGQIFTNPEVMRATTQMIQDPNIQNMMGQFMQSYANPAGVPTGGIEEMVRMGEQIASQMQQANPELVEVLRRQFGQFGSGEENPPQGRNPPDDGNSGDGTGGGGTGGGNTQ